MSNTDIKLIAGLDLDASPKQIVNDVKKIEQTLKSQGIKLSIDLDFDDGKLTKSCKDKLLYVSKILSDGIKISPQLELDKNNLSQVESKIKEYYKNIDGINDKTIKVTSFKNAGKEITSFVTEINRGKGVVEKFKYALKDLGNGKVGFEYDGGSIVDKSSVDFKRATQQAAEYQNKLSELKSTYKSFLLGTSENNSFKSLVDTLNFKGITDTTELDAMVSKFKEAQAQAKSFNAEINKKWSSNAAEKLDQYIKQLPADLDYLESKFAGADIKIPDSITNSFRIMREQLVSFEKINEPEGKIKLYNELSAELNEVTQRYKLLNQEQKNTKKSEELSLNKSKLSTNINTWINQNSTAANLFASQISDIKSRIQNADSTSLKNLQNEFSNVQAEAKQLGLTSGTVAQGIRVEFDRIITSVVSLTAAFQTFNKMVNTARELDKELFNLQVATGNTRDKTKELLDTYNSMAKELGSTTIQISNAADAWLRQGKNLEETNTLIRDSVILSKIGMIDSADATTYITSALKGYKLEATDALGVISKLSAVDIVSASDAGGLAEAMSRTAASADLAGVSMDKLLGIIATIKETSQDSDEIVGTSVRTMLARYGNIKIGKFVDDETGEALNDVEATLNKLGIVTRVAGQFRDFEGVLDDVGKQWESFNSIEQNAIAAAMFGTRQRDRGIILLENYANALKYTEISANSTTEALEKFEYYQESLDAHVNSLKASYEQLASVVVNSDFLSNATDAGAGFLDTLTFIIDKLGVLSTGIGTLTIGGALKGKTVGLFGNNGTDITFLGKTADEMRIATAEGERFGGIFAKNVVHPVQNASLIIDNYNRLVDTQCVSQANLNRITDDAGMLSYIQGLDGARASMTGYTASLQMSATATTGLKIATVALNMALNMGVMFAFTSSIQFATEMINGLTNQVELAYKAAESATEENEELKSSIESINSELETTKSKIDELEKQGSLSFVEQAELQKLRDTTEELERQLEVKTALQKVANEDAREAAIDYLNTSNGQYRYGGWDMSQVENGNQRYGRAIDSLYTDNQVVATEQMITDYQKLIKRQEELNTLKADFIKNNPQGYADEDAYRNIDMESVAIDSALSMLKENIPKAIEELDKFDDSLDLEKDESLISQINSIQDTFSGLFGGKATSVTDNFNSVWESDSFKQYRAELEKMALTGEIDRSVLTSNENYKELLDATGAIAEEVAQNIESLVAEMENVSKITSNTSSSISDIVSSLDDFKDSFEPVSKLYQEFKENGTGNFNNDNLQSIIASFKEIEGVNIEDFLDTLTNTTSTAEEVQEAFNNLASEYVNVSGILDQVTESNADYVASKLEEIGITNSVALVEAELTVKRNEAALAARVMSDATYGELAALRDEIAVTDEAKFAINQFYLEKLTANGISLATNGDIENIMSLVQACGSGISALKAFHNARQGIFDSFKQTLSTEDWKASTPVGQAVARANLEAQVKAFAEQQDKLITDAQKEVDAALNKKYSGGSGNYGGVASNSGGSGGGSGKGSGGGSGSEKEPKAFDWMERRVEVIDSQVDKLQDKIDILVGYKSKNKTTDTAIDLLIEKMDILQQMHDRYMSEADKIGLAQEYIDKIQNGLIDLESIGDEGLVKQIQDYQDLYDKAESANKSIIDTKKSVADFNKSKLDNINNQFKQTLDITNQIIDTEKQLIDLREKSGETVYADDYISLAEKQLELTNQNIEAYKALSLEMRKQKLKEGSEEWKEYNDQLQEYKNNMISAADAVEQYKDAMTELVYKDLNDFKSAMDSVNGTISTMNSLIGNVNLIDDSGNLTDRGLTQVALYAQQLANAKQESANYAEAIRSLDEALDSGLITQDEYNERLYEYTSAQESAVQSTKDAKDAMIALVKEGIQAQIDAKRKLTDETIAALRAEQDLYKYQNEINEKQKNITTLQKKIAALANASSGTELATRLKLEQELAEAQKELYETQYDHNIEQQENALNEAYDAYEKEKQKEMDELDSNLAAQEKAIEKYLNDVKKNYSTVYKILTQYGDEYSLSAIESLTSPWESGTDAANLCSNAIGDAISSINFEISNLDMSPLLELIEALNSINEFGMGSGSLSGQFEDISGTGSWQKGKGGKWWYGEDYREDGNYDYASDGIYTIDGKQYGFDDKGYMQTEWAKHDGNYYYFDKNTGEMQKSLWIPGKDGKQYYLTADGVMAEDMAIKYGDGYCYVDKNGVWDGKTISLEEVERRGLEVGYKRGTLNATPGWHMTDEDGIGTELIVSSKGVLRRLDGGETVFNADAVQNLWDFASNPTRFMGDLRTTNIPTVVAKGSGDIKIDMPITIEGSADEKTVAAMKSVVHDEMVKFTKNDMFDVIGRAGNMYRR